MNTWDAFAPQRQARRAWIEGVASPVTNWLTDALAVQPGETFLELAAGAGGAGFAIVERGGAGVRLISSDVSPATVDVARRGASDRGLGDVEFRVLDAQHLDLPSASVDAVVCRWGFMLMPEPASAFRECARVLRAGGRLAFSVWGDPAANRWTTIDAEVCAHLGYTARRDPSAPGGMFSLADPRRLRTMVEESGFSVRRIESVPVRWPYATVDDYIAIEIGQPDPRGDFLRRLTHKDQQRATRLATELLEPFRNEAGYVVSGQALNVLAAVDRVASDGRGLRSQLAGRRSRQEFGRSCIQNVGQGDSSGKW